MKANSLSQKELAEKIGIRRPSISDWKKNKSFPYADVAVKIAKILGVSVEFLITGEDDIDNGERNLLNAYRSLNEIGKTAAIGAVNGLRETFPLLVEKGRGKRA